MSRLDFNTLAKIQESTSHEIEIGSTSRIKEIVCTDGTKYNKSLSYTTMKFGYWNALDIRDYEKIQQLLRTRGLELELGTEVVYGNGRKVDYNIVEVQW